MVGLSLRRNIGGKTPCKHTERQLRTVDFFNAHPVFSLDQAADLLVSEGGRPAVLERLQYHVNTGRLKRIARGIYGVIPPGVTAAQFHPDPFLCAVAIRPDSIFSHHSALSLLGAAHSIWNRCTLYTSRRRQPLRLDRAQIHFLEHPGPMRIEARRKLGTRQVEYHGRLLRVTGPERTLVEGFRQPDRVGGLEELVISARGFAVIDLDLLQEILECYDTANLWAATGWFLERFQESFHVNNAVLERMARHRPRGPQYLMRNSRGGVLIGRWNLFLPKALVQMEEADER